MAVTMPAAIMVGPIPHAVSAKGRPKVPGVAPIRLAAVVMPTALARTFVGNSSLG
jgi:hypothetical protein